MVAGLEERVHATCAAETGGVGNVGDGEGGFGEETFGEEEALGLGELDGGDAESGFEDAAELAFAEAEFGGEGCERGVVEGAGLNAFERGIGDSARGGCGAGAEFGAAAEAGAEAFAFGAGGGGEEEAVVLARGANSTDWA